MRLQPLKQALGLLLEGGLLGSGSRYSLQGEGKGVHPCGPLRMHRERLLVMREERCDHRGILKKIAQLLLLLFV